MNKGFIPTPKSSTKSLANFKNILSEKEHGFTLIELIVVIIIVGILAAVGMTQYSSIVEKARTAEAKVRVGTMRQLAYEYYLNNGNLTGIQNSDVGVTNTCSSTDFYNYWCGLRSPTDISLVAHRCTSGGKTPNVSRGYSFWQEFHPDTGQAYWACTYDDNSSSCFGLPTY